MSEQGRKHELDELRHVDADREPEPGVGSRSVLAWQTIAEVRHALTAAPARAQFDADPLGFLGRFGLDASAVALLEPGPRLGLRPVASEPMESKDAQLAFCRVWGCVIVVAAAAGSGSSGEDR